jgi:hypothetical protein
MLTDTALDVQLTAYQLMYDAAKKYTEAVVLEAETDNTGSYVPQLPAELLSLLESSFDLSASESSGDEVVLFKV